MNPKCLWSLTHAPKLSHSGALHQERSAKMKFGHALIIEECANLLKNVVLPFSVKKRNSSLLIRGYYILRQVNHKFASCPVRQNKVSYQSSLCKIYFESWIRKLKAVSDAKITECVRPLLCNLQLLAWIM